MSDEQQPVESEEVRCAECHTRLAEGDERVLTEGGVFCPTCFEHLRAQLVHALRAQSEDINYSMALAGALAGGAVGVLVWWGFTVVTKVAFGLVAVVIGIAVGKGITMFVGPKRSLGLQALSVGVAAVAFFYASYLVNRTFIQRAFAEDGTPIDLPWVPDLEVWYRVVAASFGVMDVVFLAIVLWQAWKIPAPVRLDTG